MVFIYNKSSIGFSHINNKMPCQDHSVSYGKDKIQVITACDGHGGNLYFRSNKGSKFASQAVIDVINLYSVHRLHKLIKSNKLDKLKLEILCKWNELVEQDYSRKHFSKKELDKLNEEELFKLANNYICAYGTTLNAAILTNKFIICIQIGDGGVYLINKNNIELAFPENDENVANITNSMCADKAFDKIYIKAFYRYCYNGIIICTDGLLTPYQTYTNFKENFIVPFLNNFKLITIDSINKMNQFIEKIGLEIGTGDDVSIAATLY